MTYGEYLAIFLATPMLALVVLLLRDRTRSAWHGWAPALSLLTLLVVATIYTTPWDNHLVASHVWSYDPALVNGASVGAIPIEEFIFFPTQTLLLGLWFIWLSPRLRSPAVKDAHDEDAKWGAVTARMVASAGGVALWLAGVGLLMSGWRSGTYLGWELAWALPPIVLQLLVGGDVLWRRRVELGALLLPAILYLCATDALAIAVGIWRIDPQQSVGVKIGGALPLEEAVFFSLTSVLVMFGMTLALAPEVRVRLRFWRLSDGAWPA